MYGFRQHKLHPRTRLCQNDFEASNVVANESARLLHRENYALSTPFPNGSPGVRLVMDSKTATRKVDLMALIRQC